MIGLIQHITFDEWLPVLLGQANFDRFVGNYNYDREINPTVFNEFAVGGLRVFDTFIAPRIFRSNI